MLSGFLHSCTKIQTGRCFFPRCFDMFHVSLTYFITFTHELQEYEMTGHQKTISQNLSQLQIAFKTWKSPNFSSEPFHMCRNPEECELISAEQIKSAVFSRNKRNVSQS